MNCVKTTTTTRKKNKKKRFSLIQHSGKQRKQNTNSLHVNHFKYEENDQTFDYDLKDITKK